MEAVFRIRFVKNHKLHYVSKYISKCAVNHEAKFDAVYNIASRVISVVIIEILFLTCNSKNNTRYRIA